MSLCVSAGVALFPLVLGAVYFLSVYLLAPVPPFGRDVFYILVCSACLWDGDLFSRV